MRVPGPDEYLAMLDAAAEGGYAYPAINVTSSQSLNAAVRGFSEAGSDGIVQITTGGAAYLEFLTDLIRPTLPGKDGDRIVGIYNWDLATSAAEQRSLHDFGVWRDQLRSVEELGAYAVLERNLITDDGRSEAVSGFQQARGPTLTHLW